MIGTRILKINLELAEIIEVKVATFNIEIIFLPASVPLTGANFDLSYLNYF